jgi:NADPH:quinone reductase-like Zn-dependent oxidoreductase
VNYIDVVQRKGTPKVPLPYTPALEGVGRVAECAQVSTIYERGSQVHAIRAD